MAPDSLGHILKGPEYIGQNSNVSEPLKRW